MAWRLHESHKAQIKEVERKYQEKRAETLAQYIFVVRQHLERKKEELEGLVNGAGSLKDVDVKLASLENTMGEILLAYEHRPQGVGWGAREPQQISSFDCLQPVIETAQKML